MDFPIAPAASRYLWFIIPVLALLAGVMILMLVTARGGRNTVFTVDSGELRLRGDLYGRTIPLHDLHTDSARRVNLAETRVLQPVSRTMGTGLPGYQSGWFRLRNGEKALLYLTDRSKAIHVPTTNGYSLLISPDDPDAFLAALRRQR